MRVVRLPSTKVSMFKAWLCRHVGLETSKVRRVVLCLYASCVFGYRYTNAERTWLSLVGDTLSGSIISLAAFVLGVLLLLFRQHIFPVVCELS
jgi:hypothetical protein